MTPGSIFPTGRETAALAEERARAIRADLETLIGIDTQNPPGREADVASFLADRLRSMGGDVRLEEVMPGRPNVVATFAFGDGPTFMLTSHTDTVPIAQDSGRGLDAYVEDGRMYGRGACDAKGSLVAMVAACGILTGLAQQGRGPHGSLVFAGVIDEETGGTGTKRLAATGPRPDWALVGEPTELRPTIGHKGSVRKRLVFRGRAAHSSDPDKGINAIYRAARFVLAVENWNEGLRARTDPLYGKAAASANVIAGGTKVITIPDRCWVEVDRRLLPGESEAMAMAQIGAILHTLRESDADGSVEIEDLGMSKPAGAIDPSAPLATTLQTSIEAVTGKPAPFVGFQAGSDMAFLTAVGVPTAIFGPGSIQEAHAANEHVHLADVESAAAVYTQVALRLLGSSPGEGDLAVVEGSAES